MGIPNLSNTITFQFPTCQSTKHISEISLDFDHLLIDLSPLLYSSPSLTSPKQCAKRVFEIICRTMNTLTPRKSLFIAMDGPGPRAKLVVQKQRREKVKAGDLPLVMRLTPGSKFLNDLALNLYSLICNTLKSNPKFSHLRVFLSSSQREDEGEFKLVQYLRHLPAEESCVVLSSDSDMIPMCLQAPNRCHIIKFSSIFWAMKFHILDVDNLKEQICLGINQDKKKTILDFCYMILLLGNDYCPKLSYLGGSLSVLWSTYISLKQNPEFQDRQLFRKEEKYALRFLLFYYTYYSLDQLF